MAAPWYLVRHATSGIRQKVFAEIIPSQANYLRFRLGLGQVSIALEANAVIADIGGWLAKNWKIEPGNKLARLYRFLYAQIRSKLFTSPTKGECHDQHQATAGG